MNGHVVTYRLSARQRVSPVVVAVLVVALQVALGRAGFALAVALLFAATFAIQGRWSTEIAEDGLTTSKTFIGQTAVGWDSVKQVDEGTQFGARVVRLSLEDGDEVKLRVPVDGPFMRDGEFEEKLTVIRETWWSAISEPST